MKLYVLLLFAALAFVGCKEQAKRALTPEELAATPLVYVPLKAATQNYSFEGDDIQSVLESVASENHIEVLYSDAPPEGKVSVELEGVTWRELFRITLEPLGYTHWEDADGVHVMLLPTFANEEMYTFAVPVEGDLQAAAETMSPLVDIDSGGSIQLDHQRNALVITERQSRREDILVVVHRIGTKKVEPDRQE
ncbi:hypothetical protein [Cerasicoccus maritimus]|uniref:hypothetical protein n=1 Tax=Cerasicoccus maritimus TaxID=490089 RepID=UPI002852660E|nr:hypothetical protein [Cerasicoccus maritimus]